MTWVAQTADGGFALFYPGLDERPAYLILESATLTKVDSIGRVQWIQNFSEPFSQNMILTGDGGFAYSTANNGVLTLCKLDPNGNSQWNKTLENPYSGSTLLMQTNDSGFARDDSKLFRNNKTGDTISSPAVSNGIVYFGGYTVFAVNASADGGTITVNCKQVYDNVEISFADTGVGIPEDILPKIFSPLFTTKAQGMGFGLAICKRIVDAHGGKITVETSKEKGTTFTVTLPVEPKLENEDKKVSISLPNQIAVINKP